ncbi:MAG: hypothetical protein FJ190_10230 [Gammaproteobacteria bacterium]|nr:hypothetical protein [Gammaproteobacteria bacterium]
MTNETGKPAAKSESANSSEIESDADDIFEDSEFAVLPESLEKESIRRDARRKIEIYWEKRRLREQFEDFDESEFGF